MRSNPHPRSRRLRLALYSPGRFGLGHMRRNLLLAQILARSSLSPTVLMFTEARESNFFRVIEGVDCLTLPALGRDDCGQTIARHLEIPLEELLHLRSRTIQAALEAFAPDVLIVDHRPRGASHELDAALETLRAGGRTRCVLGLRDVLDDPLTVASEWQRDANEDAILRFYEAVWIYGDPAIYNLVNECGISDSIRPLVRFTGYLDHRARLGACEASAEDWQDIPGLPNGRLILCLVGGGEDGLPLAEAFVCADQPADACAVLVTGPYMPASDIRRLRRLAADKPRLRMLEFLQEPTCLLTRADRIVSMGGYNSVSEILSFEKPALIVPRVRPRVEQWIRAEILRDMGLIDVLHPDELSPQALSDWLCRDLPSRPHARDLLDLDGGERLPELLEQLVFATAPRTQHASVRGLL